MAYKDILKPMPRRPWLAGADPGPAELKLRKVEVPKVPRWLLIWRGIQWQIAIFIFMFARMGDAIRRDKSLRTKGRRLRELFERVGGTGIKIGQQMAMRVDFLPYAVTRELDKLMDAVKPFPLKEAITRIESSLGRPVDEMFTDIDPEPIGSASIACVWAATLVTGERVAIKVRRPGIERLFMADVELVAMMTHIMEALSVVRPGFMKNLRTEMREMFMTELDFVQEANYQILFRRAVKKARIRWLSAPKVFVEYSSRDILTSKFVNGTLALDVLNALETNDQALLDELRVKGIRPKKMGQRILDLSYWMRLESIFFHSDPHPGNIFVMPGNKLVLIDFGACGMNQTLTIESEVEMTRRMLSGDAAGAVNASMASQAPFPNMDLSRYAKIMERVFWKRYVDIKSKQSEWWERTTAGAWLMIMDVMRDFQVPANINMLRLIRSSLLYDTLAFRLNPDIDFIKTFRKWGKGAAKRNRRAARKARKRDRKFRNARVIKGVGDLKETADRGGFWLNQFMRTIPKRLAVVASQASYVISQMIKLGMTYLFLLTLGGAGVAAYMAIFGDMELTSYTESFKSALQTASSSPVFIVVAVILLFQSLGHIQKKLREKE